MGFLLLSRVAHKLVHQPTIRVKELANSAGAVSYAEALAELFALDPQAVEAVTSAGGADPLEVDLGDLEATSSQRLSNPGPPPADPGGGA